MNQNNKYFQILDLNNKIYIESINYKQNSYVQNFGFNQVIIPSETNIEIEAYCFTNNSYEIQYIYGNSYDVLLYPQGKLYGLYLISSEFENDNINHNKIKLKFIAQEYDPFFEDILFMRRRKIKKIKQSINNKTLN